MVILNKVKLNKEHLAYDPEAARSSMANRIQARISKGEHP